VGAPSYLAGAAADRALAQGTPVDAYVVNGFPLDDGFLDGLAARYRRIVTIEDGLIGDPQSGTRGAGGGGGHAPRGKRRAPRAPRHHRPADRAFGALPESMGALRMTEDALLGALMDG